MTLYILSVLLLATWMALGEQRPRPIEVRPADEATAYPELVAVRAAAIESLEHRDVDRLMTLMADDVKSDLRAWFTNIFRGNDITARELRDTLAMGGTFTTTRGSLKGERQFCAPYFYSAFPTSVPPPPGNPPDLEAPQFASVIVARNIAVRSTPGVQAPIVAFANYSLVKVETLEGDRDANGVLWERVTLTDGTFGFVPKDVVRSPFDYHVCFGERDRTWRITELSRNRDPNWP